MYRSRLASVKNASTGGAARFRNKAPGWKPCVVSTSAQLREHVESRPAAPSHAAPAPPKAGSVLGAASLITGSAVGAGILALPQVTQATGFYPSATLLLGAWSVLLLEALLLAEVNLRCHAALLDASDPADADRVIPLAEMTRMTVGAPGEAAVSAVYLTLSFTLLLAYTARAGDLINAGAEALLPGRPATGGHAAFAGLLGTALIAGGTPLVEKANCVLTAVMLALFIGILGTGATRVDWATGLSHADWTGLGACVPVMFLALVYHDLIPIVCHYLGFDRHRITASLLAGSAVPLAMFVGWEAVCLGLVPFAAGDGRDPVDVLIATQGAVGGTTVALFSLAALGTSAIGTSLSLTAFFRNRFAAALPVGPPSPSAESAYSPDLPQVLAVLVTLLPPTIVGSVAGAHVFQTASHYAGAYGMSLLYGVLPPLLSWSSRAGAGATAESRLLPGGRPVLAGLMAAACVVGGLQLSQELPAQSGAAAMQPIYQVAAASESLLTTVALAAGTAAADVHPTLMTLVAP